ncbi:hypothetical protein C8T65DRAFT_211107 [Cerioporus squamosus]|nr:hypothetical protein C8T65DRAFT_211107 [Cerioporus squamosus]
MQTAPPPAAHKGSGKLRAALGVSMYASTQTDLHVLLAANMVPASSGRVFPSRYPAAPPLPAVIQLPRSPTDSCRDLDSVATSLSSHSHQTDTASSSRPLRLAQSHAVRPDCLNGPGLQLRDRCSISYALICYVYVRSRRKGRRDLLTCAS